MNLPSFLEGNPEASHLTVTHAASGSVAASSPHHVGQQVGLSHRVTWLGECWACQGKKRTQPYVDQLAQEGVHATKSRVCWIKGGGRGAAECNSQDIDMGALSRDTRLNNLTRTLGDNVKMLLTMKERTSHLPH